MADVLKLNLDRYNITILQVEGIGFKPYIAVCNALNIPWVLRTDNDIFTKPKKNPTKNYYSGLSRVINIIKALNINDNLILDYWDDHSNQIEWPIGSKVPDETIDVNNYIKKEVEKLNIFLSNVDLENDLANSAISSDLFSFHEEQSIDRLVHKMKNRKAENMYSFINENSKCLDKLKDDNILLPLIKLIKIVEGKKSSNDDIKKTN